MSGTKSSSRLGTQKKEGGSRYATRFFALEKGKRNNPFKETNSSKSCNCLVKSDGGKGGKTNQNSKLSVKKTNMKCAAKDNKKRSASANHREKVVIVSKRSSSVSVVKSCKLRKSVSVKKVSYSTSVVLSSDEEEEDTDSEEEESEEEEKKECLRKKKTVLKRTTSKVKSSVRESKKAGNKSKKKDKAIKLLCEKLSSGKNKSPSRELRPRFPYNMLQEWPTARTHRMASLNALAKVHVLYENEGRVVGENIHEADETTLIDFLNQDSEDDSDTKKDIKPIISSNPKKNEKAKAIEEKPKNVKKDKALLAKTKIPRRGKKRKLPEVEIIDTRICKRMASLNAQAILAASYQLEPKPKRNYKRQEKFSSSSDTETEVDLSIVKTEQKDEEEEIIETPKPTKKCEKRKFEDIKSPLKEGSIQNTEQSVSKKITKLDTKNKKSLSAESEVTIIENSTSAATVSNRSCTVASAAATTQVGMTQYTEVTKVQINTHKDSEIKEESKSERKIKHIVSNEDVAITQMYRYQSETANESYCVQMQTTYKPSSKSMAAATNLPSTSEIRPYGNESPLSNTSSYYGHSSMLPSQAYPSVGPVSPAGIDRRLPRHYGASAFSVPHYKHSQHMQFPPNEYGYYQPAGPLIQPVQDQVIHKPVPYHPQPNRHQTPQRPQPTPHHEGFQAFEPRQTQQKKSAIPCQSSPQQKSSASSVSSPRSEAQSRAPSPQTSRSQPQEEARSKSSSSNPSTSFQQPPKHVRSPVMPTLYSSQNNFRNYQTQKRMPNTFGNCSQTYEKKDQGPKLVGYDSRKEQGPKLVGYSPTTPASSAGKFSTDSARSRSSFQPSKEVQHQSQSPNSHSAGNFKNRCDTMGPKQRMWDFKTSQEPPSSYNTNLPSSMCNPEVPSNICNPGTSSSIYNQGASSSMCRLGASTKICHDTSSNFLPYRSSFRRDAHHSNLNEVSYPPVITLDEDSPRDTKTYIQLEVPKNSHREKIVIVDVEDDEIDTKHNYSETSNLHSTIFDRPQDKLGTKNVPSRQANSPNVVFDRPQDNIDKKYTHSKNSNTPKTTSNILPYVMEKKHAYSRNSDIPNPAFDKPQDKVEKKHIHTKSSNMPKATFDKAEKKHTHSRNTEVLNMTLDEPQTKIEKKQAHSSTKQSDMPLITFDRPQDKIEKRHTHSKNSDTSKTIFDRSQDKVEMKHTPSKHSDMSKITFDKPQDKIENKHIHLKNSDVSKASFGNPQDKIEKKHTHSKYLDLSKATTSEPQNKTENKSKLTRNSDMPKATFDKFQDKSIPPKKNMPPSTFDNTKSSFNNMPNSIIPDVSIVKIEKISEPDVEVVKKKDIAPQVKKCDKVDAESPEVMIIEVKKKKESAVVRRAKMQGKQRTFRDCYNRPLAQLFKNKKKGDALNISEQHLSKDFQPLVSLPRLVLPKVEKPPAHGWSWEGTPRDKLVYISNDDPPCIRRCYPSIRHVEGDVICERDCVFLRSGPRKTDLPFVAKVTALWEMPTNGEMTMSLLWYYRPEHTETGRKFQTTEDEILASKHRDTNSVACIEDKCYVLTYSEYCRYRKRCRILEDSSACSFSPVPEGDEYLRRKRLPPHNVSPDLVLFCRRVYDYRQRRLLKNPL